MDVGLRRNVLVVFKWTTASGIQLKEVAMKAANDSRRGRVLLSSNPLPEQVFFLLRCRRIAVFGCALSLAGAGWLAANMGAQSQSPVSPTLNQGAAVSRSPLPASRHAQAAKRKKKAAAAAVVDEPVKPAPPPPPDWPVNDKAELASVGWNGHDLSITATNSSLAQILHDVSTATGVKVEGLSTDQRVYGRYGPADAKDVLAQLLDGSGYNVLLIGDQGQGAPRQLVLTPQVKGGAAVTGNGQQNQTGDDEAVEESEQPEQPALPPQRPFGVPPQQGQGQRTPQQMMQELQQRQQQQMQNQVPASPPN